MQDTTARRYADFLTDVQYGVFAHDVRLVALDQVFPSLELAVLDAELFRDRAQEIARLDFVDAVEVALRRIADLRRGRGAGGSGAGGWR